MAQSDVLNAGKWVVQQLLGWAANKALDEVWQQLTTPPSPQHFKLVGSYGVAADRFFYMHLTNGWYYWHPQQQQWIWATYLPVGFVPSVNFYSDAQGKLYWL